MNDDSYRPEPGHRVRAVFEGVIDKDGDLELPGGGYVFGIRLSTAALIERLPDPEPDWQIGDVACDAEGRLVAYKPAHPGDVVPWMHLNTRRVRWLRDRELTRPLTLVLRPDKQPGGDR